MTNCGAVGDKEREREREVCSVRWGMAVMHSL